MESEQKTGFRFERIEKKFRITPAQYDALLPTLKQYFQRDRYGESEICNIYYDTPDYSLIRRSIERPLYKEKLRLRSYGVPGENDPVFAEIKRKLNGIGYKRRISVSFSDAKRLLRGERIGCDDPQTEEELLAFVRRYRPQPMVYLCCRRTALTAKDDPSFRVTFDRDLRYRITDPELPGKDGTQPVLPDLSEIIMEIKALGGVPFWFADTLSRLKIYQAPFSKIGTCYTLHIAPNIRYPESETKKG